MRWRSWHCQKYRKRLRTTNMQERLNEEIRRRERVIRIFPNDASALRLIGALLAEKNEVWQEKKYLDMKAFKDWAAARPSAGKTTPSWLWPAKNNGIYQITFTAKIRP